MEVVYKNISHKQVCEAYEIHKEKLGEDYLSLAHFMDLVNEGKLLLAIEAGKVYGYLTIDFLSESEFFESKKIKLETKSEGVVVFNTCSVSQSNKGIGSLLFEFALNKFAQGKKVYCPVWQYGEKINAHNLLTKFGFKRLIKLEKFWYEESLKYKNYCPICGSPCICTNLIYIKNPSE